MPDNLALDVLRQIPYFLGFSDAELALLAALFEAAPVKEGEVLFDAGQAADAFYLLTGGEVTLLQTGKETFRLRPTVLIGEFGALTGLPRNCKAVAGKDAVLWRMRAKVLAGFLADRNEIGVRVQAELLHTAADKINRDQRRLEEMRANIIRTQKAMKWMRDLLLEAPETEVSKPLHDTLEGLIRKNRRANYRVEPPPRLPASWRLEEGGDAEVVEISRSHVSFRLTEGELPSAGGDLVGVLCLAGAELPVSGTVLRTIGRRGDVELDLLIDEYAATLEGYLTQAQMLDYLV